MASYNNNLWFFFILGSFHSTFATTEAPDIPFYLHINCSTNITTPNSAFPFNLRTLLSSLSSNATGDTQFYNTTVTGLDSSESVYGLFICWGDVPSQLCHQCVENATQQLSSNCSSSRQAVIWYEECMVRFSNRSFFSTMDTRPRFGLSNNVNISTNQGSFTSLMFSTVTETANEAARHPIGVKKFATREATISELKTLYCLAQCTPDLSPLDCRTCLSGAIGDLPWCCEGKQGGRVLYPSCNVRYELYPFYRSSVAASPPTLAPALVPATTTSKADSKFSKDPVYLHKNCTSNQTISVDRTFQIYLKVLFSYLSSNATSGKTFYKDKVDDVVYGLFLCRGDLPSHLCSQCVQNATHRISSECGSFPEAIIWYSHCLLRYSNRYFVSIVEKSPVYHDLNVTSNPIPEQNSFTCILLVSAHRICQVMIAPRVCEM